MTVDNEELDALVVRLIDKGDKYPRADPMQMRTLLHAGADAITALRARVAELQKEEDHQRLCAVEWFERATAAESQLQQVKADAERYRWLRDTPLWSVELNQWSADWQRLWNTRFSSPYGADPGYESLDAAIDAARRNNGTA